MNRNEWKNSIIKMTEGVGTYKPEFDSVIDTLADILEQRDRAYEDFINSGAEIVITKISDRGAENVGKNPRLTIWSDLNTQALAYWRELGLTSKSLKDIRGATDNAKEESALEAALKKIGGQELGDGKKIRGGDKGRKKGSVQRAKASR